MTWRISRRRVHGALRLLLLGCLAGGLAADSLGTPLKSRQITAPSIASFSPASGGAGTPVTILGTGFRGVHSVAFNGTSASYTVVSSTQINTVVPAGATNGPIGVVTQSGTATSADNFSIIPAPMISSFTPSSGPLGTAVTLDGSAFTGATLVTFNGTSATFSVVSDSEIATSVPSGATSGKISVSTPGGTGLSAAIFNVLIPPTISSFSPTSGPEGTTVTLVGSAFTGATAVTFDGTAAVFSVASDTQIITTVPNGATTGNITVSTPIGTASSLAPFTVVAPSAPQIESFSPASGTVGTAVTLSGSGFSGATSVTFNGVAAVFTVDSDSTITTSLPAQATTGPISVTSPLGTAFSSSAFTVELAPPPQVDSFAPASGPIGTLVTLAGSGFTGATTVAFNDVPATQFTATSDTQLEATVPEGAATGKISVTAAGNTTTTSLDFTVVDPTAQYYGVPWNADGLSNTPIGRSYNRMASYRFRARRSGEIAGVRIYLAFAKISKNCTYTGYYAGGNGGQILLQLETDDGTPNHFPGGTVLASYLIQDPLACSSGTKNCTNSQRQFFFDAPATVLEGELYHLVFSDIDPKASCNWTSIDNLYNVVNTANMQPAASDIDFAELIKDTGDWQISYSTTPIISFYYADGTETGQGFMYRDPGYQIQGSNMVREIVTVSGADVTFSKAYVRLQTSGNPGPLTVTVQNSDESVIDSATLEASSIDAKGWASVTFAGSYTLTAGQTYYWVLSAPADSANYYLAQPLQAGTAYGFDPSNVFDDGHFQSTTDGTSWQDYNGSRTDFDLQLYLAN